MLQKVIRLAALPGVLLLGVANAQTWQPPIGIPTPSFGINEAAPPRPNPWTSPVPGYYYVDEAKGNDNGNAYGTPSNPRETIPNPVPAGSVVELHGTYSRVHTSPHGLVTDGTASKPVWIRGQDATQKPIIKREWEVNASYTIFENLEFAFASPAPKNALEFRGPTTHSALRHSIVRGHVGGGGVGIYSFTALAVDNFVVWDNRIVDNGDVNATYDQDVHGISLGAVANHIWVVDNEMARNSGDGIQINAGKAQQAQAHHFYIGRNVSHHNKQTGFWTKQAVDVLFSQNTAYGHRVSDSSQGDGMGGQYAPSWVWYLFNTVYDNESGIRIASDSGLGSGTEIYVIGNLIYNTHKVGSYNPNTGYENAAISFWGGTNTYVINNTLWDIDAGINSPRQSGKIDLYNNIIDTPTQAGASQIFYEFPPVANSSAMQFNLLKNATKIRWGDGAQRTLAQFQATFGKGQNSVATDNPLFVNAAGKDFHLQSSSPAVNAGAAHVAYTTFFNRYGIDIAKDIEGRSRPWGSSYDIGAYEFGAQAPPPPGPGPLLPPTAPNSLQVN